MPLTVRLDHQESQIFVVLTCDRCRAPIGSVRIRKAPSLLTSTLSARIRPALKELGDDPGPGEPLEFTTNELGSEHFTTLCPSCEDWGNDA